MNQDQQFEWMEKLAEKMLHFRDEIESVVKGLPGEQLLELARLCHETAKPAQGNGLAIPMWEEIAEIIEAYRGLEIMMVRAKNYMEKTGETYYCLYCDGACTPKHIAELHDDGD